MSWVIVGCVDGGGLPFHGLGQLLVPLGSCFGIVWVRMLLLHLYQGALNTAMPQ